MTFDYSAFVLTADSTENDFSIGMSIWLYANDDEYENYADYLNAFTSDDSAELVTVETWKTKVADYDGYTMRV